MAKTPGRGLGAPRTKRPSRRYSAGLVQEIRGQLEAGMTISDICRLERGPSASSFHNWKRDKPGFADMVSAARLNGADALVDEVLDTARAVTAQSLTADREKMLNLRWAVGRNTLPHYGERPAQTRGRATELHIRVRRFEKLMGEDGRPFLREILPEGEQ